jgi:UPF0716 protein FxsA
VPLLVFIFIVVPIAELYVIIKVGGAIGVLPTLAILIADALLGAFLLRHQGRAAWMRFNRALNEGRVPHREVLDGVLIVFGGALLLTPGFITDVFGLILLIPPTRAIVRGLSARLLTGRVALGARAANWGYGRVRGRGAGPAPAPGWPPPGGPPGGSPRPAGPRPGDIEGTAHEVPDDEGGLPEAPPDTGRGEPDSR